MNESEHIQELTAEVADLTRQLRQAGSELTRLRELLRQTGEENQRLRARATELESQLGVPSAPVVPTSSSAATVAPAAPAVDMDAVSLRKKKLAEEIERARQTIQQAAMIRQQMAELERITQTLAQENDRLRESVPAAEASPAPAPAPTTRSMIARPAPPPPAVTAVPAPTATEADPKLKIKAPVVTDVGTSVHEISGRRMVFLNSLFGRNKS
jgi:regulator of replication initiation timing